MLSLDLRLALRKGVKFSLDLEDSLTEKEIGVGVLLRSRVFQYVKV